MNRCNHTIKEYHVARKVKWKNVKIMWMKSRTNLSYLGLGRLRKKTSFNNNYIVDVLVIIIWKIHLQIKKQYLHRQVELCDHSSNLETDGRRCKVAKFRSCGEGCSKTIKDGDNAPWTIWKDLNKKKGKEKNKDIKQDYILKRIGLSSVWFFLSAFAPLALRSCVCWMYC